jgi:internalin A
MQYFRRLTRQIQRWLLPYLFCLCLGTFLVVACTGGMPDSTSIIPGSITPNAATTREFIAMCENRAHESEGARNLINVLLKEVKASDCRTAAPLLANLEFVNLVRTSFRLPDDADRSWSITDLRPLLVCQRIQSISFLGHDLTNTDLTPLSRLTTLEWLSITNIDGTKLEFLKPLTQLRTLELESGKIIRDFSALAGLTQLRKLIVGVNSMPSQIEQHRFTDLSPLANLQQLEVLTINQNQVADITPLKGLKQLQYLSLHGNKISSLQALAGLTNLISLTVSKNKINDLRPLAALSQLESLDLSSNRVKDLQPLVSLRQLRDLSLNSNQIEDITPLAQFSQLAVKTLDLLDLSDNQIRSVKGLENFKALERLFLQNNKIKDLQSLAALTMLTGLYLNNNSVSDLRPLATLQKLEQLELASNLIHDLRPLAPLRQLFYLNLTANQITDITPLGQLGKLDTLSLADNRIRDVSALQQLKQLVTLYIQNNPASRLNRCPLQNIPVCQIAE